MRWAFGASTRPGEAVDQTLRSTWESLKQTHGMTTSELVESHVAAAIAGAAALVGSGLFGDRHTVGVAGTSVDPAEAPEIPPARHQIMVSVAQLPALPVAAAPPVSADVRQAG